jgi:hypothetical protein
MKRVSLVLMVVFSISLAAEARKGSNRSKSNPLVQSGDSQPCPAYDCSDAASGDDSDVIPSYGGDDDGYDKDNDGSDYIHGMPY